MSNHRRPRAVVTTTIPLTLSSFHRELVRQLLDEFDVHVVSAPGAELEDVASELGVTPHVIPMSRDISVAGDALALWRWVRLLVTLRPSLLVSATPKASMLSQVAGWLTRVPRRLYVVGGLRLEGSVGPAQRLLVAMERLTFAAATHVVVNSQSLQAKAIELHLARAAKIRTSVPGSSHGVDSQHYQPRARDGALAETLGLTTGIPVVGFVGRLTHDKGIDALIVAARHLEERGVEVQWLVVGSQIEPDSALYAQRLKDTGSRVTLVGGTTDVRPFFSLMDVHVLPSLREGFPNVVLEASAMAIPTVATDATGAVDSVRHGVTGLIVPVQDGAALAGAVTELLADPSRRARMGEQARQWVASSFDPPSVVASLLAGVRS